MAPSKAVTWPTEIYDDEAVMSLDKQGRFIVCRVCADSFAVFGGKSPKPVTMNACFRTRAWETHKRRTRAHRKEEHPSIDAEHIGLRCRSSSFQTTDLCSISGRPSRDHAKFLRQAAEVSSSAQELAVRDEMALELSTDHRSPPPCATFVQLLASEDDNPPISTALHQLSDSRGSQDSYWTAKVRQTEPPGRRRSHPLVLSSILNPLDRNDERLDRNQPQVVKRQRTGLANRSSSDGRTATTSALYWKTMREVFRPAAANTAPLDQS